MVGVRIEGGQDLARALGELPTRLSRRMMLDALTEAGEPMRKRMGQLAPREPGAPDLADHMVISQARKVGSTEGGKWTALADEKEQAVAIGPSKEFFYGLFQEFGTVRHGAQPFMRPAFQYGVPLALKILVDVCWRELAGRGISRSSTTVHAPVSGPGRLT